LRIALATCVHTLRRLRRRSHIPVMKRLLEHFKYWGFTVCGVYALDATFMGDPAKFISGTLLSLSAMVSFCSQLAAQSSPEQVHVPISYMVK
jgi:Conserved hypothetical ATP binding protein